MRHYLKTWPKEFEAIRQGSKRFELRSEIDRSFTVGDLLFLKEWDPHSFLYSGQVEVAKVTYILRSPDFGLPAPLCVLSIEPVELTGTEELGFFGL